MGSHTHTLHNPNFTLPFLHHQIRSPTSNDLIMKFTSACIAVGGLSAMALAQDVNTVSVTDLDVETQVSQSVVTDSTEGPQSTVVAGTSVDTNIIRETEVYSSTSSLPSSLLTSTSVSSTVIELTRAATITDVINTLSDGTVETVTEEVTSTTGTAANTAGGAAGGASADESSSTDSDSGAMPTEAARYIPAGVAAAVFGLAAAL